MASAYPSRDHEAGLAQFIAPQRRARFVKALDNPRLRRKLRDPPMIHTVPRLGYRIDPA